jgi:hypothetical protein
MESFTLGPTPKIDFGFSTTTTLDNSLRVSGSALWNSLPNFTNYMPRGLLFIGYKNLNLVWYNFPRRRPNGQLFNWHSKFAWNSFLTRAAFGRCCHSVRKIALQLHAISILRPERPDHGVWRPDGWTSSAWLALSRIAFGQNNHVVLTVEQSSHICVLERNILTCRTLKGVRKCCWVVWTNATKSSSKFLDIEGHLDGKFLSSGRMMLWHMSVWTEFHVVWTDARELNYTILNRA